MYVSEVNEAFDNPYPYTWDSTQDRYAEFGNDSFLAKAEMDMGELLVMFTLGKPGVSWTIDFAVDGAMDKTGDGDQFRIFATVVAVIKDWIANKVDLSKVTQIDFSSDKDGAAEDSRSKLYKRFGQQLASKLGWNLEVTDRGQFASFKIKNPNASVDEDVTQPQLNALEKAVDKVFGQVGIDVEFTRHFLDRANDARNGEPISIKELAMLFKKEYQRWGKPIAQMGPNAQAVLKDLESDINVPFVLQWDRENNELDMIAKTVMRKKDFRTSNKEFPVEALTNNVMQRAQQQLSEKSKIDPKLIEKIIAKALELGIDPNILLAIAYKESRIRTGLTGDKNKKDFAHGIFQVRKPAMQDVNRYYKTNYSVDDMKNDVDANIDAGARYYKMMYDAYGAKDLESALAGYNGGPKAARTGKNKQANNYASSVNNISKDIQSVITVPQPKKVTPSKNEPYRDDSTDPESWDEPEYPMVDPKAVDRAVKQAIAYEPPKTATKQPEIITTVLPPAPTEPSLAPATSPRPKLRPTKTTYQDLAKSNNISNPDLIKVGQKINMPDGTTHTVRSGDTLSDIAKKHNRRSLESKVEEVFDVALENFADGKKKGKSRPGRVKRAGASCNGSVTELRKKAKNSSGERAKMYHWCANMKSGRKKSK
jgi:soluble lytic murein transglycosylase-like protein